MKGTEKNVQFLQINYSYATVYLTKYCSFNIAY